MQTRRTFLRALTVPAVAALGLRLRPMSFEPGASPQPGADLRALYEEGETFQSFLESTGRWHEAWQAVYDEGGIDADVLARARAVGGTWRFLVIAEPWCRDSMNAIPYLAHLVALVDGLDMRVIRSRAGREVMEAHRTPDGRPATPTVILMDADWNEAGCFVERPTVLRDWVTAHRGELESDEIHEHVFSWYEDDRGAHTADDFTAMLEGASGGAPRCGTG